MNIPIVPGRIILKLHWICDCGAQHGMRGHPDREAKYINGPLDEVATCRKCGKEVALVPVRKEY